MALAQSAFATGECRQLKLVGEVSRESLASGPIRVAYPPYDVVVAEDEGEVCAIEDACNHAGASLSEGDIENGCIECPMHGYLFSLRTGELVAPRGLCGPQRTYRVEVVGDVVRIWDEQSIAVVTP